MTILATITHTLFTGSGSQLEKVGDRRNYRYPKPRLLKSLKVQSLKAMVIANSQSPLTILENGDRLHREEFERRYIASKIKKAELIEGIVHVATPLRFTPHGKPHSNIITWLGTYQAAIAGIEVGIEPI